MLKNILFNIMFFQALFMGLRSLKFAIALKSCFNRQTRRTETRVTRLGEIWLAILGGVC
jgi:hypothetical protein